MVKILKDRFSVSLYNTTGIEVNNPLIIKKGINISKYEIKNAVLLKYIDFWVCTKKIKAPKNKQVKKVYALS